MGHLKDIANQPNRQTFPNSTYEIEGEPPASQCSEARIEGIHGITILGTPTLTETNKFVGFNLAGKVCHITAPPANVGDYDITLNTDGTLIFVQFPPIGAPNNEYFITNGGSMILTRNIQSFAQFISAAGYSYTIKGAKLYTNIPPVQLQPACTILFDPLT